MQGLPKFLLATDPTKDESYFIIHTEDPQLLAEVYEFETREQADAFNEQVFNMFENKQIPFAMVGRAVANGLHIFVLAVQFYGKLPKADDNLSKKIDYLSSKEADHVSNVMKQMAEWYGSLIENGII